MKESIYKNYDELPLFLNVATVAKVLGIAPSSSYELMHEKDFPALRIGNRIVVPKEAFIRWGGAAHGRGRVKRSLWPTRDPVKDYFPLPKEIFLLGLSAAEIAIYAYLLFCEDRQTFQCWPSYRKIGDAVGLSPNTIRKHIRLLEERSLLITEPTLVTTKDGKARNGNLLFTIQPIQAALQQDYDRQMQKLDEDMARRKYADFIENTG